MSELAEITSDLSVPVRKGPKPVTTPAPARTHWPQSQVSDNAPPALQVAIVERVLALPDVSMGPSVISVPGARGFFLDDILFKAPRFSGTEFGHIHPEWDGSFHLMLSPDLVNKVGWSGWGEFHPRTNQVVMVYGPRDEEELEIIFDLIKVAYRYSKGEFGDKA